MKQLTIESMYSGYLERQELDIINVKKEEKMAIPEHMDYDGLPSLSTEIKTNTVPSKIRHFRFRAGSASKTRHANSPKCHCRFVTFAFVPYEFGSPK